MTSARLAMVDQPSAALSASWGSSRALRGCLFRTIRAERSSDRFRPERSEAGPQPSEAMLPLPSTIRAERSSERFAPSEARLALASRLVADRPPGLEGQLEDVRPVADPGHARVVGHDRLH